jgi:hypothetical protein
MSEDRWLDSARIKRGVAGLAAIFLVFAFFELRRTPSGLGAPIYPVFTVVLPPEFNFWLGHTMLVVPAAVLATYALRPSLARLLSALASAVERASARELKLALVFLVVSFAGVAAVGRDIVLRDTSVVDDEEAIRFGGQVLATGHVFIDDTAGRLRNTFELFLTWDGTSVASMDYLGPVFAHAVAEVTKLGSFLFALLAGLTLLGIALVANQRLGRKGALVAAVLLACSPMFVLLSLTQHGQLVSRTLIALSYPLFSLALTRGRFNVGLALGFTLGCAFVTRPPETIALLSPLLFALAFKAKSSRETRASLGGVLVGSVPPLAAMMVHDQALGGAVWRFGRLAVDRSVFILRREDPFMVRFANQVPHDGMLLVLFSFGLIGAVLVAFGTFVDAFTICTAAGVVLVFVMGTLHTDYGVHNVGPMHQSECVVPLCLLVTHGLFRVHEWLGKRLVDVVAIGGGAVCAAAVVFLSVHLSELHEQTVAHHDISEFLRNGTNPSDASKVVVIAPAYLRVYQSVRRYQAAGSWFNGWPRPRPDLSDDLIVLTAEPDPSKLSIPRTNLPLSPEAARATPVPGIPIGENEYARKDFLAAEESALAGRIRAKFPERRLFKLMMDPGITLVPIP